MKAIKKFLFRQAERQLKKVPPLFRGQARFNLYYPDRYSFGTGSYGLPTVHDWQEGADLSIGAYCSIANNVQIFLGGHHHTEWVTTYPFAAMLPNTYNLPPSGFSRGDVIVGNDVWLCSDVIILSGVTIGSGEVVAAGAVVTSDVEPYSVVAGNPASHVRWRFDETTRKTLLQISWWSWPVEEVANIAQLLSSSDPSGLINYAKQRSGSELPNKINRGIY
ncbi:MAG: CatB-related O-acetyltransferase [Rhodocyclaceae bacterium]|nr:MAG: CatB-related O-acetyltransferase [Rhodocyclaceae bacterium]